MVGSKRFDDPLSGSSCTRGPRLPATVTQHTPEYSADGVLQARATRDCTHEGRSKNWLSGTAPRGDGVGGNINMKRPQLKPTGLRHYPHGACRSKGFKMKSQVCRNACAWDGARMAYRHDDGTIAC